MVNNKKKTAAILLISAIVLGGGGYTAYQLNAAPASQSVKKSRLHLSNGGRRQKRSSKNRRTQNLPLTKPIRP